MIEIIQNFKIFFLIFTTVITVWSFFKNTKIGFKVYVYFIIFSAIFGFARPIFFEEIIIPILLLINIFQINKNYQSNRYSILTIFILIYGIFITLITEDATFVGVDIFFIYGLVLLTFSNYLFGEFKDSVKAFSLLWLYAFVKSIWLIVNIGDDIFVLSDLSTIGGRLIEFDAGFNNSSGIVKIDPNYFGFISGIGFLLSILFIIYRKDLYEYFSFSFLKKTWFFFFVIIIAILELWLSVRGLSRGIVLALIMSFLTFLFLNRNFKTFIFSCFLIVIILIIFNDVIDLFILRFSEDHTGGGRYDLWNSIWKLLIKENRAFFGVGLNYPWWKYWNSGISYYSTHNSWITLLLDIGIIGLILLLIFITQSIKNNYKINTSVSKIRIIMLSYFIITCFTIEPMVSNIGWLLFAVSLSYNKNKLKH